MTPRSRIVTTTLALGLTALAGAAQGFTPERAAIFVEAMRVNGCAMTANEAPILLPPLDLSPDEVQQFVDILFTANQVSLSQDMATLTLSGDLCGADAEASQALIEAAFEAQQGVMRAWTPEFTPGQGAALIGAVRGNGCALTDAQAATVLPPVGIDPTLSRDVVAVMLDSGLATVDETTGTLRLSEALCDADPVQDAVTIDDARVAFVAAQEQDRQPEGDARAPAEDAE